MTHKIHKLVVGTSLSEGSDNVLRAALTLRERTGAEVILVHGFPLPVVYGGGVYGTLAIEHHLDAEADRHRQRLEHQVERIGAKTSDFADIVVEMEAGHRLLSKIADERGAELVVVGAHEADGPLAGLLGSTADRLLRATRVPVLVVRGELEAPSKALAPVDLSELSGRSLDRGLAVLEQVAGTKVSVDALFVLSRIDREGSAHFSAEQMDKFAREALDDFLGKLADRPSIALEGVLRDGMPKQEILAYQEQQPADLVILGTHGRSGFERFLLGSVASEVLRHLETHALVVPPDEAGEA